jgi:hypothetical protein
VVELSAVNRSVLGSNPSSRAIRDERRLKRRFPFLYKSLRVLKSTNESKGFLNSVRNSLSQSKVRK